MKIIDLSKPITGTANKLKEVYFITWHNQEIGWLWHDEVEERDGILWVKNA